MDMIRGSSRLSHLCLRLVSWSLLLRLLDLPSLIAASGALPFLLSSWSVDTAYGISKTTEILPILQYTLTLIHISLIESSVQDDTCGLGYQEVLRKLLAYTLCIDQLNQQLLFEYHRPLPRPIVRTRIITLGSLPCTGITTPLRIYDITGKYP